MSRTYNFCSRHLSATEVVTDMLHQYGAGILVHAAVLASDIAITRNMVYSAFQRLSLYQPALRMLVKTEMGTRGVVKRFEPQDHVEVPVEFLSVERKRDWLHLAEEECMHPFNSERGPLWKVKFATVTKSSNKSTRQLPYRYLLIFKIHHVIADHVSIKDLLEYQLVDIFKEMYRGASSEYDAARPALFMIPSQDDSFAVKHEVAVSTKALKNGNAPSPKRGSFNRRSTSSLRSSTRSSNRGSSASSSSRMFSMFGSVSEGGAISIAKTQIYSFTLGQVVTSQINQACRRHRVCTQDVFTVAASCAFAVTTALYDAETPARVTCCHPLNLREYHGRQTSDVPLGLWLCHATSKVKVLKEDPSPEMFWQEAVDISQSLLASRVPWRGPLLLNKKAVLVCNSQLTDNGAAIAPSAIPQLPKAHVEVSTLVHTRTSLIPSSLVKKSRDTEASSDGPTIALSQYHFVTSQSDSSCSPIAVNTVELAGNTFCTVTSNDKKITREFAREFSDSFARIVQQMSASGAALLNVGIQGLPPYIRAKLMERIDEVTNGQ